MKKNVIDALSAIHRTGLDNTLWNIEDDEVSGNYYGDLVTTPLDSIPPHVAIFDDAALDETFIKCDYAITSRQLGLIYIYEL